MESPATRMLLRFASAVVLLFMYLPLVIIGVYAFDQSRIPAWPITNFSTQWFGTAFHNQDVRNAFVLSIKVGLGATAIALVLGSAAAFAVHRFRFFGRETVSFLLVLPIALPGIVTGLSLLSAISYAGITPSIYTIIVAHATFCMVVVFNNAVAALRRSGTSLQEASMDLGADGLTTFRYVTLPSLSGALVAGGLLAFALSFDEVIVTLFVAGAQNTLPLWIFNELRLPNQAPQVNVVALAVILLTLVPVLLAQRLMRDTGGIAGR